MLKPYQILKKSVSDDSLLYEFQERFLQRPFKENRKMLTKLSKPRKKHIHLGIKPQVILELDICTGLLSISPFTYIIKRVGEHNFDFFNEIIALRDTFKNTSV